jgi:hypothetical protein
MHLLLNLKSFYLDKAIKEGKLISKADVEEDLQSFVNLSFNKYLNNLTSKTQLEKLLTKNEEQREHHFTKQRIASFAEIVFHDYDMDLKTPIRSFILPIEEGLIEDVEQVLNIKFEKDESRLIYIEKIINFLDTTEDRIRVVTDEIKNPCEFKKVLIFIVVCDSIAELPKRDRRKIYEEKRKFERLKESTITNLKTLNLSFDEVERKEFIRPEYFGWYNYETTIKHYKSILFYALTYHCKAGKKRANEIVGILDYL